MHKKIMHKTLPVELLKNPNTVGITTSNRSTARKVFAVYLSRSGGPARHRQVKGGAVRTPGSYLRAPRLKDAAVSTEGKALFIYLIPLSNKILH